MIHSLEKGNCAEGVQEGAEQEGQENTAVPDDGPGEGDHHADDEHAGEGEEEAKPGEGGEDVVLGEAVEIATVAVIIDEGEADDPPDEDQLQRKDEIDGAATRSGEGFEEAVLQGGGEDANDATP
jgi:hypothetical protein